MRFVALDLENDQPSNQIIQIGAAAFDTDMKDPYKSFDQFNCFVDLATGSPNYDAVLRGDGTLGELLGDDFKSSWANLRVSRQQAFTIFWEWLKEVQCGKKILQWGRGDFRELTEQSKEAGVNYPNKITEMNLKRMYQFFYVPGLKLYKGPGGLQKACGVMGIDFDGRAHDALVDAENTGKLAVKMYEVIRNYKEIEEIIK